MLHSAKICSLDHLLAIREEARRSGRQVVHCHGCFDIVHPGHIHHLEYARSLGDLLIVSVSSDTNVNKGVNRPLIPDDLRASSLAALQCVDFVYINSDPTAVELLEVLQPDIYVKGKEYEHNNDPRFLKERDTVIHAGGRVVFSSGDVVYSSTALINSLESIDCFEEEKLARLRRNYDLTDMNLLNLLQRVKGKKILVVGDYILDRYNFCDASGVAGEAPMMALKMRQSREYDGGGAIIAQHLAAIGAKPVLVTALAGDDLSHQVLMRLAAAGVDVRPLHCRRQVITKQRFLADSQKLFKVDEGAVAPLDSQYQGIAAEAILDEAADCSAAIFADFGYGLITAGLLDAVLPDLRRLVGTLVADVSGPQTNLLNFRNFDLLCPTEREVRETLHDFSSGMGAVISKLLNTTNSRQAIITMGKQGLVTFDKPQDEPTTTRLRSEYLPAFSQVAIDPLGCGDALLAIASATLAAGGSLPAAAFLGSLAASIEVQRLGNIPITTEDLLSRLSHTHSLGAVA